MDVLFTSTLWVLVFLGFAVLLPGVAIRVAFLSRVSAFGNFSSPSRPGDWACEALACGSAWSGLLLLVFQETLLPLGLANVISFPGTLLIGNVLLLGVAVGITRPGGLRPWREPIEGLLRGLARPDIAIGVLVSVAIGAFSLLQFPYAVDNSALYWVARVAATPGAAGEGNEGAIGYLAWLCGAGVLAWPEISPSTIGAAAKIPLHLLAFFTAVRLCAIHPLTRKRGMPILLYLLFLPSFAGDYGLIQTGKETVFSILFIIAAMATGLEGNRAGSRREQQWFGPFAALLSLAIGFGAIAIPYGGLYLLLLLVFGGPIRRRAELVVLVGAFTLVPLPYTFSAMLHWSYPAALLGFAGLVVGVFLLRNFLNRGSEAVERWLFPTDRRRRIIEMFLFIMSLGIVAWLLPVRFDPRPLFPIDGESDFHAIFLECRFNGVLPPYYGYLAIGGMILSLWPYPRSGGTPSTFVLFSFLFIALIPVLAVVHLGVTSLPFHPQKLWDLAKDIPNWTWGFLAAYAVILLPLLIFDVLLAPLAERRGRRARIATGLAGPAVLVGLSFLHFRALAYQGSLDRLLGLPDAAFFTSVGGHREANLALVSEALVRDLGNPGNQTPPILLVDREARFADRFSEMIASGIQLEVAPFLDGGILAQDERRHHYLAADRSRLGNWWEREAPSRFVEELVAFPMGDSLFRVRELEAGEAPELRLAPAAPFPPMSQKLDHLWRGAPQVNWTQLVVAPRRTRNGAPFFWGAPEGVLWISPDESSSESIVLELKIRFLRSSPGTIELSSPALPAPLVLTAESRKAILELDPNLNSPECHFYGRDWVPLYFRFDGEVRYEEGFDYPKIYQIERLDVFGYSYL